MPETLPVFSPDEYTRAQLLLAGKVAHMMGRKLEEGDWTEVYCRAKGIMETGWSNLHLDIMHDGLGIEQKMLAREDTRPIKDWCGTRLMHPALTRSIRISSVEEDPNVAMRKVIDQFTHLVEQRREKVRELTPGDGGDIDLRSGWLLYQSSLRQFMYWEVPLRSLDPDRHRAEWSVRATSGTRKASKNLWIYNKDTGQKVWSVTTDAGAKIQPYFDVPPPNDPNVYVFVAQGLMVDGFVKVWLTLGTANALRNLLGTLDTDRVSNLIFETEPAEESPDGVPVISDRVEEVLVLPEAYEQLLQKFPGVSDEHAFRLLLDRVG